MTSPRFAAISLAVIAAQASSQCPPPAQPVDCAARVPGTPLPYRNAAAPTQLQLGGATTVELVILGHSESRGYHVFLQPLLDALPPLPGVQFNVTNLFINGHEAWRWRTPGNRGYSRIQSLVAGITNPTIVLGLFSNNASFPIQTPDQSDANYVRFVDDLEAIADLLDAGGNGVLMTYFSAHRYKPTNVLPCWYENCAIGALMTRAQQANKTRLQAGPEQHDLHWCCFPSCYARDMVHTNAQGDLLMARTWHAFLVRELTGCASVPFGTGTPGTAGAVPVLGPVGGFPMLGNSQFGLALSNAVAGTAIGYAFGASRAPGPLLLVQPDVVVPAVANAAGDHTLALGIPNDPSLAGGVVQTQGLAADAAAMFGVASSQGLELRLCR